MVLADSTRIPRVPAYSGYSLNCKKILTTGLSPSMVRLSRMVRLFCRNYVASPTTPRQAGFRLFPFRSPLLRESLLLSFPALTKMFQFSACAFANLCIQFANDSALPETGCPIRIPTDQSSLTTPRGFSQLAASFIAT